MTNKTSKSRFHLQSVFTLKMLSNSSCAYFTSKQTCVKNYLQEGRPFIPSSKEERDTTVAHELLNYLLQCFLAAISVSKHLKCFGESLWRVRLPFTSDDPVTPPRNSLNAYARKTGSHGFKGSRGPPPQAKGCLVPTAAIRHPSGGVASV